MVESREQEPFNQTRRRRETFIKLLRKSAKRRGEESFDNKTRLSRVQAHLKTLLVKSPPLIEGLGR